MRGLACFLLSTCSFDPMATLAEKVKAPEPMMMAIADPAAAVPIVGAYNSSGAIRYVITNGREPNTVNAALYDGCAKKGSFVLRRGATFTGWDGVLPPDWFGHAHRNNPVHFEFEPSYNAFSDGYNDKFVRDHSSSALTIFTGPSGDFPGKISAKELEGCWCGCSCCFPACACDFTAVPGAEEDEYTNKNWGCVGPCHCCCPAPGPREHHVRNGKTNTFRHIGSHDGVDTDEMRCTWCLEFREINGSDKDGNPHANHGCLAHLLGPRNGRRLAEHIGPWEPCLEKCVVNSR